METNFDSWSWLSFRWFTKDAFSGYSWEYPEAFYLLALIPLFFLIKWLLSFRNPQRLAVALPEKELKWKPENLLRFVPHLIMALIFSLAIVALARPQKTNEKVEQWTEGIDIMLVIDISESMQLMDFRPNRLEAAKKVARDFISGRFQDRIGLVVFSGDAYSLSPLTTDYDLLFNFIEDISFKMIQSRGTAIGSAIAVGTNRMIESETNSKVMILLSDGENNAGNIDPITAAELASSFDIKIYTIAIGKEGKVPGGKDMFGNTRYYDNTLDETTLREIAKIGDGRFYRVSDNRALEEVFQLIDEYEKAEIKETTYRDTTDFYPPYLSWAIALFLVWLALKSTFVTNVLQD